MKKPITIISLLILSVLTACHKVEFNGQTGKILHKKYNPALTISYIYDNVEQTWDTLRIDLDQDKETDLKIYFEYEKPYIRAMQGWEICKLNDNNPYISLATWWERGLHVFYGSYPAIGLRHQTDEGYYYGWLDCYSTMGSEGQVDAVRFYLRETAYCTCLDYPLQWGQK